MNRICAVLVAGAALGLPALSLAQGAMLEPPENHYFKSTGSWGQKYADQWGLHRIGFDASPQSAWRLVPRDAAPVIVAVVDTGLDWNHKNIDWNNIWRNSNEVDKNKVDDDKNGYVDDIMGWDFYGSDNKPWDYDGHGTFVTGLLTASWKEKSGIAGVNPLARIMVVKALNNFGHTRSSYIAQAITYAANNGARVINLSVGGKTMTKVEKAAIDYAYSKGVVIVAAAGNEGIDISGFGIAASDKVISVAATGMDDERANFSNWGKVSVAAPGVDILSLRARRTDVMLSVDSKTYKPGDAFVGPDRRYYRASGTSFSAPLVTGLASLMIAKDPSLSNRQVMNIIISTARDVGAPGVDQYTGYGIIDARAALQAPKDYFLFAGISRVEVVTKGKAQAVRVRGTADANALKSARIEIGAGETPKTWKTIGPAKKSSESDAVLADIPASAFSGAKVWQIRVLVTHDNNKTREARFKLRLG
jgi:hypothetical protein